MSAAEAVSGSLEQQLLALRSAARAVRSLATETKNKALRAAADRLLADQARLLDANAEDLSRLPAETAPAFRDRLTLTPARIAAMAESLRQVAALADPVGEVVDERTLANGLCVRRVRAPLGVIFMIFESRPNVITEALSLAFKAGNVIVLRGGSESAATAGWIYRLLRDSFSVAGVAPAFVGIEDYDRAIVGALLRRKDLIDVVVPRGGEKLIDYVQRTSLMPIIKNDRGLCHTYVAGDADLEMAVKIVTNAKTQRPGVCNALETVLVDEQIAPDLLPRLYEATKGASLEWRADEGARRILGSRPRVLAAQESDWDTEHLEQIINCRLVRGLDEALAHIERHGSRHSEAIVTADVAKARRFQDEVDAAAVYWNASTRFTDGFELGLGGELGVSTQKLHVRGPVGLRELTSPRWVIDGAGQIRS